jgi:hypothetical protein
MDDKEYIEITNLQLLIEHNSVFPLEDEDKSSQLVISVKASIILGNEFLNCKTLSCRSIQRVLHKLTTLFFNTFLK